MKISEEVIEIAGSLGIPRSEMPQIDGQDIPEFLSWLRLDKGVGCESRSMQVNDLQPSQSELDTDKADKIWDEGNAHEHPIIISEDDYVLDGHHRWLAVQRNDSEGSIRCHRISLGAKEALDIMHSFEKSKKIDINDKPVEGLKLSQQILFMIREDNQADYSDNLDDRLYELGFDGIEVAEFSIDLENKEQKIVFTDGESELLSVFWVDEELGPVVTVVEDESELEAGEFDVIELDAPVVDGMIDFDNGVSWLSEDDIETILTWDEVSERAITVVRAGKKVRKQIVRKKRKKRLSAKRKLSIRRAVRKKKAKKAQIQRKRTRSLKLRKRAKLKNKPKNQRVVG